MAERKTSNYGPFSLHKLKYEELWDDAISWIQGVYKSAKQQFTTASPFSQILSVLLHLSRLIFYYIEDSITGLNIRTAYREDQIRGLATLSGHIPGRAIGARGAIRIAYNNSNSGNDDTYGKICYIPNRINLKSLLNGRNYVILFGANIAKMIMGKSNYVDAYIVEGKLKTQKATASGRALESFNFTERNYGNIDQYFINVYVNGERWEIKESLIDLGYLEKACIVRTGMLAGIDVFFGNNTNGLIPQKGASIRVEYIVCNGFHGNLPKSIANSPKYWQFEDVGFMSDGTEVDLNKNFSVSCKTDIVFGSEAEDIVLTQQLAPNTSRSYVLANETNYKYFLGKMNMFSTIEVTSGYNTMTDRNLRKKYNSIKEELYQANEEYQYYLNYEDGEALSPQAQELKLNIENLEFELRMLKNDIEYSEQDDNTIFLMLIPDIKKRISGFTNYFDCDYTSFFLNSTEKATILELIEQSQQKMITVENRIIDPQIAKFAINATIKMWDNYKFENVYTSCLTALSNYLLNFTRKDLIPLSDIIALFENVEGVDSVRVSFDADVANINIYGDNYGIDEYGDIKLTRSYIDETGALVTLRDVYPLFRGNFTSYNNIYYSDSQAIDTISAFNLKVIGYTSTKMLNTQDSKIIN